LHIHTGASVEAVGRQEPAIAASTETVEALFQLCGMSAAKMGIRVDFVDMTLEVQTTTGTKKILNKVLTVC
jgi:hypothetical protein